MNTDDSSLGPGWTLLRNKKFGEALDYFLSIFKAYAQNGHYWYGLGIAALRTSNTTLAFRSFRNAISLGVAYPDSLYATSELLKARKRFSAHREIQRRYENCFPTFQSPQHKKPDQETIKNSPSKAQLYSGDPIDNLTIICHLFNEEYLLPWWLKHHTKIAKNGILINYASTDRSVDICRQLAPHWTVVDSRNEFFSAREADNEVMDWELSTTGWKLALNVTEFLYITNSQVQTIFSSAPREAYALRGVVMATAAGRSDDHGSYCKPITSQFRTGLDESIFSKVVHRMMMRNRILHSHNTGKYYTGRHFSEHETKVLDDSPLIIWYGYSPWNRHTLDRKLQIQNRIPAKDFREGIGVHHLTKIHELEKEKNSFSEHLVEIFDEAGNFIPSSLSTSSFGHVASLTRARRVFLPPKYQVGRRA